MVFKIAGWVSFEQVRIWLDKQGRRHQYLENGYPSLIAG